MRCIERFGAAVWVGLAAVLFAIWPDATKTVASDGYGVAAWLFVLAVALAMNARLSYRRSRGSDE